MTPTLPNSTVPLDMISLLIFKKLSWLGLWNVTQKLFLLPSSLSWTRSSQSSLMGSQGSVLILFTSLCKSPGTFMQCHDFKCHQCAEIIHIYRFSPKVPPEIQTCVFSPLYHCLCECLTGFPNLSKVNLLGLQVFIPPPPTQVPVNLLFLLSPWIAALFLFLRPKGLVLCLAFLLYCLPKYLIHQVAPVLPPEFIQCLYMS